MNGLKGLLDSRKAVMVILVFAGLTALLMYGKLDSQSYALLIGGIKAAWLGAHSHEESNKAKAGAAMLDKASEVAIEVTTKKDDTE